MLIEVIFFKEELLHDINAALVRVERTRHLEDISLTVEGEEYSFDRQIESAIADIVKRTSAYQVMPSRHAQRVQNNHTYDWVDKSIMLNMPHSWPPTAITPLRTTCHDYIVKTVLHEQLAAMLPNDPYTHQVEEQKTSLYSQINAIISERMAPLKTHPTPFG